jgi:CysZ protein
MALFTNFKTGFRSYKEAHRFIVKHKLWLYVFLPAVINVAMILLLIFVGWHYFGLLTDWLMNVMGLNSETEGYMGYLVTALQVVFRVVFQVVLFLAYSGIYRYIVLIILSPMLAPLSEKTDKLLTGKKYPFVFKNYIIDVIRGIGIAIRNSLLEFLLTVALFFFSFVPIVGYISPVIIFFVSCYFYGFSMMDYTNERQRLTIKRSARFVRRNMGFSIANGMVFYIVFFFVPVIGFMVAPAYAVVAATLGIHEMRKDPLAEKPEKLKNPRKWKKRESRLSHT